MKTTSFTAAEVSCDVHEHDVRIFAARPADPPDAYVMIQRTEDDDDASDELGLIHFEWCGQGYGAYDVIAAVELSERGLHISLEDDAIDRFDGQLRYEVRWSLPPTKYAQVTAGLRRVFRDTTLLKESDHPLP